MTKISSLTTAVALLQKSKLDPDGDPQSKAAPAIQLPTVANAPGSATRQATTAISTSALSGGLPLGGGYSAIQSASWYDGLRENMKAQIAELSTQPESEYVVHTGPDAEILDAVHAMTRYGAANLRVWAAEHILESEITVSELNDPNGAVARFNQEMSEAGLEIIGEAEMFERHALAQANAAARLPELQQDLEKQLDGLAAAEDRIAEKYAIKGSLYARDATGALTWGEFEIRDKTTGSLVYSHAGSGQMIDYVNNVIRSLGSGWNSRSL